MTPEVSAEKRHEEEKVDEDSEARLSEASSPQASEAPEGGDRDEDVEMKLSAALITTSDLAEGGLAEAVERRLAEASSEARPLNSGGRLHKLPY